MGTSSYKVATLFGEIKEVFVHQKQKRKTFHDYDGFIEKFKPKKTTDDCYTPPEVYDYVLNYVSRQVDLTGKQVVRPFYPGGDYKAVDYTPDMVVIDNPPFSIFAEICRFYVSKGVKFFLFAPHLTFFSAKLTGVTYIVVGAGVRYENGAEVNTSFVTNMFGDIGIIGEPDLLEIERISHKEGVQLPTYRYPTNVVTSTRIDKIVSAGVRVVIPSEQLHRVSSLDAQRLQKKSIYGGGFLCSTSVARMLEEKEAEAEAAKFKKHVKSGKPIIWELSDREKKIIKNLDANG